MPSSIPPSTFCIRVPRRGRIYDLFVDLGGKRTAGFIYPRACVAARVSHTQGQARLTYSKPPPSPCPHNMPALYPLCMQAFVREWPYPFLDNTHWGNLLMYEGMFLAHVIAYAMWWALHRYSVTRLNGFYPWCECDRKRQLTLGFHISLPRYLRYVKRGLCYAGPTFEELDGDERDDMSWEGENEALRNPDPNRPRGRGYGSEGFVFQRT